MPAISFLTALGTWGIIGVGTKTFSHFPKLLTRGCGLGVFRTMPRRCRLHTVLPTRPPGHAASSSFQHHLQASQNHNCGGWPQRFLRCAFSAYCVQACCRQPSLKAELPESSTAKPKATAAWPPLWASVTGKNLPRNSCVVIGHTRRNNLTISQQQCHFLPEGLPQPRSHPVASIARGSLTVVSANCCR